MATMGDLGDSILELMRYPSVKQACLHAKPIPTSCHGWARFAEV